MEIKKCIVIGANGYIGKHLLAYLQEKGALVTAYDNFKNGELIPNCESLDILDNSQLKSIDWNVDAVFHFAGLTGTYNGFDNYANYFNINEIGLVNVLTAIRNSGHRPRLVFPSTRLVYKGADFDLPENAEKEAKTIYAANKIACEFLLDTYRNIFGIDYTIFRICVPYGNLFGDAYSYGTIGFFINQSKGQGAIKLYGDGSLRRTFSHVQDICYQIFEALKSENSQNDVFNIAGESFSLKEVAEKIALKFNANVNFDFWPENDAKIESGHTVFDGAKISQIVSNPIHYKLKDWIENLE